MGTCVSPLWASNSYFCLEDGYFAGTFWVNSFPQGASYTWYPPYNWDYSTNGNVLYLNNIYGAEVGWFYLDVRVDVNGESVWRSTAVEIRQCYSCPPGEICYSAASSAKESPLKVFPNPATINIQLEFSDDSSPEYTLNIFDKYGTIKMNRKIKPGSLPIDVSNLDPGMYIISVSDSRRKWIDKFFVEK